MRHLRLLSAMSAAALIGAASPSMAQVDVYIGQVMTVAFSFCPQGWLDANGQTVPISSYQALYALLGVTYGGDGRTNFQLPDLQGRVAMGQGTGPSLPPATQGQKLGAPTTTLTIAQLPPHDHQLIASTAAPTTGQPNGAYLASFTGGAKIYAPAPLTPAALGAGSVGVTGQGQSFDQHQPSLVLRYCIATEGVFPIRP
jgi:microcystin-dependent protein